MNVRLIFLGILSLLLACCSGRPTDSRLEKVAALASDHPKQALDSLEAIDYSSLSDANRHYYDFLKIKALDKAYIIHTSDSLILDVIDYYSSHKSDIYPEALYYGGRVYADLGDYPTAIEYFQESLTELEDTDNQKLKASVLSQNGQLLHQLRLYNEAEKYLTKAISLDSLLNDTLNLAYDHQSLGQTYYYNSKIDSAKHQFNESTKIGKLISEKFEFDNKMFLAELEMGIGNIDTALFLTKDLPNLVSESLRNYALTVSSYIYLKAGLMDSAYKYSYELIHSNDSNNKRHGYKNILSKDLLKFLPSDSITEYFNNYYLSLNDFYNKNKSQLAVLETAKYNYKFQENARIKTENTNEKIVGWLILLIILFLVSIIIILTLKIKEKQILFKLNNTLLILNDKFGQGPNDSFHRYLSNNTKELKTWLAQKVSDIEAKSVNSTISSQIMHSKEYQELQSLIRRNRIITDSDYLWTRIHNLINTESPYFFEKIQILIGTDLKQHEIQTITLIRCGISPSQMAILLGKTKTTISSRRKELCNKIIGEKTELKVLDAVIRML